MNLAKGVRGHALCQDPDDLAVTRLAAAREKDHVFVAAILDADQFNPRVITASPPEITSRPELGQRINRWIDVYVRQRSRR